MRFFTNPRKPMILALARPDPKKNLITLVKAFGECRPLRDLANLVCSVLGCSELLGWHWLTLLLLLFSIACSLSIPFQLVADFDNGKQG